MTDPQSPFDTDFVIRLTSFHGLDTREGARDGAFKLFEEISKHHGDAWTRRLFAIWGAPPSARSS